MKFLPFFLFSFAIHAVVAQDTLPARVYHLSQLPVITDSSRNRVQIMDGPTSVLSNMEVHLTTLAAGMAAHPPHTHTNQEELIIVQKGMVKVTIAGKSKILSPGSVAYALPGDEHGAVNAGKTMAAYYIVKYTTRVPIDPERGKVAGGSIMMDWAEPKVDKTDRGERRSFYNRATTLFGKFDMHVTTLNKGAVSHLPHTHRSEEIILVKTGTISMRIGDQQYPAAVGDVVFLPTGVPHALQNTSNGNCTYFAFQWE